MESLTCEPVLEILCPIALLKCPKSFTRTNMNAGCGTHPSFLFGRPLLSFCLIALASTSCPELSRTDCPFLMTVLREETSVILLPWDRFSALSDWAFPFGLTYSTHLPSFSDDSHLPCLLSDAFFSCLFKSVLILLVTLAVWKQVCANSTGR